MAPVCIAIALAGCAASSAADRTGAVTPARATRAAMQGDGPPAQPPPLWSMPRLADDPAGQYNPLHGSRPPYSLSDIDGPWSTAKESAIIAQAITAHEMRRP